MTMPTTQEREQLKDLEQCRRETLHALIEEQVMHALGKPGDLLKVQVRPLWKDHYRANVVVGTDAASARVAHSYFLVLDDDGKILASAPPITRQY
jgi:hypothetical protein